MDGSQGVRKNRNVEQINIEMMSRAVPKYLFKGNLR